MGRLFSQFEPQGPMARVREGMEVYDRADERVGTVTEVHLGDGSEEVPGGVAAVTPGKTDDRHHDSIIDGIGAALGAEDRLPEGARDRLLRVGYIAIDAAGIFTGERFATTDQVASVDEDRVVLNVGSDDLMRR